MRHSIISFGQSCLIRVLLERYKLYDFKENRSVRMPFDGCNTPYKSVVSLLSSNFNNVFHGLRKDLELNIIRTSWAKYNHEKSLDIDLFMHNMRLRISQFNKEICYCEKNKKPVLFFIEDHPSPPIELINLIREKYPSLRFKFFCLYRSFDIEDSVDNQTLYRFVTLKSPWSGYVWSRLSDSEKASSEHINFEKKTLKAILSFLPGISSNDRNLNSIFENRN